MKPSLYEEAVAAGVVIGHHYSDLYIKANEEGRALAKKHEVHSTAFWSKEEKCWCLDIPLAYDPYWERKGVKCM